MGTAVASSTVKNSSHLDHRPFGRLGGANHGWLNTKHHFSFANYFDPNRLGWGDLLVWNDDTVKPKTGFGAHPHRDMEIISYVYEGAISHQDSNGNKGRTEAGDVQTMVAGTGVVHSEYNLEDVDARFFQIWIKPNKRGLPPSWGTRKFPKNDRSGRLVPLASGFKQDQEEQNALPINTDSRVLGMTLEPGEKTEYKLGSDRVAYIVPARGSLTINGLPLNAHDGLAIKDTAVLSFEGKERAEIVMVDTIPDTSSS